MHRTRIKICGLTRADDAAAAVAAGADALGVILHADSPRRVGLEDAARVLRDVPPPVARIGVFVNASIDFVREAVDVLSLTSVQFHGSESPEFCSSSPVPVVKAFRVGKRFASQSVEPFRGRAGAVLLDTYSPHMHGGTGTILRWQHIPALPGWAPLFLAGGLNAENVGEAILLTHPFAVDVSSGVELSPGIKDPAAIHALCDAVRAADSREGTS
ncbi:MAG: phosphoribosylanthranilate isomerase [Coriobacteriia bacterium]